MLLAALLLAGLQSSTITDDDQLPPAPQTAIVAGGKACIGATTDAAGQDARLTGWTPVTGGHKDATAHRGAVDGRIATHDGVRLTVSSGIDGGCVVQARADVAFDKARFLAELSNVAGTPIDGVKSSVDLPNGELMVVQVGGENGKTFVQLVVANQKGKHARVSKGN